MIKKVLKEEKGTTLVEVMVALTILAIVLVSVVTLAVNAVGLMTTSRLKTEATALAQEGVQGVINSKSNDCNTLTVGTILEDKPNLNGVEYERKTTVTNGTSFFTGARLVTTKVTWDIPGTPLGEIEVKRLIDSN